MFIKQPRDVTGFVGTIPTFSQYKQANFRSSCPMPIIALQKEYFARVQNSRRSELVSISSPKAGTLLDTKPGAEEERSLSDEAGTIKTRSTGGATAQSNSSHIVSWLISPAPQGDTNKQQARRSVSFKLTEQLESKRSKADNHESDRSENSIANSPVQCYRCKKMFSLRDENPEALTRLEKQVSKKLQLSMRVHRQSMFVLKPFRAFGPEFLGPKTCSGVR
jgi:hypothetical protein